MENLINILVTGGGAPGAPGIIKALRSVNRFNLFSCDVHSVTAGKLLANDYFTVLQGDNEEYCNDLLTKCLQRNIKVIFPITTKELIPLSVNKSIFKQNGIDIIVSDFEPLQIANNKGLLYQHLQNADIAVPSFFVTNTLDEFKKAAQQLGYPNTKFIFKPCQANGSRGFRIVENGKSEHDLLFNEKPNATFISYEKTIEILSEKPFPSLVVSEYLPGKEYTVDCLVENGKTQCIIPRSRDKMNNGISVAGTIEKNQEIIDYCRSILDSLPLDGPIGIQVKYSSKNAPLLVEINPRIQGTSVACIGAGVNIPAVCVYQKLAFQSEEISVKWGTQFIRYYDELYFDE